MGVLAEVKLIVAQGCSQKLKKGSAFGKNFRAVVH